MEFEFPQFGKGRTFCPACPVSDHRGRAQGQESPSQSVAHPWALLTHFVLKSQPSCPGSSQPALCSPGREIPEGCMGSSPGGQLCPSWGWNSPLRIFVTFGAGSRLVGGLGGRGTPRGMAQCPHSHTQPCPTVSLLCHPLSPPLWVQGEPKFILELDQPPLRPGPWLPPAQVALWGQPLSL